MKNNRNYQIASELIAWAETYFRKMCPSGIPTRKCREEIMLFARVVEALRRCAPPTIIITNERHDMGLVEVSLRSATIASFMFLTAITVGLELNWRIIVLGILA